MAGTQGRCLPVEGQEFAVAGWAGRAGGRPRRSHHHQPSDPRPRHPSHRIASWLGPALRCPATSAPARAPINKTLITRARDQRAKAAPAGWAGGWWLLVQCNAMQCNAEQRGRTRTRTTGACARRTPRPVTRPAAPHRTAPHGFCSVLISSLARPVSLFHVCSRRPSARPATTMAAR